MRMYTFQLLSVEYGGLPLETASASAASCDLGSGMSLPFPAARNRSAAARPRSHPKLFLRVMELIPTCGPDRKVKANVAGCAAILCYQRRRFRCWVAHEVIHLLVSLQLHEPVRWDSLRCKVHKVFTGFH